MKLKQDIDSVNKRRSINALILCVLVIIGVFIGLVIKLTTLPSETDPDEGIMSFRYFTVLSNMFMGVGASLCIPYEIDGLRTHNYHLPYWVVEILYCSVCCVTVTFTIAFLILAPSAGFSITLFQKANLFLHTICPILSLILFIYINDDHQISFKHSFVMLIPLMSYAFVYCYEAFISGGWRDHYYISKYFNYWVALAILPIIGLLLANIVRILHNKRHKYHKEKIKQYYMSCSDYDCANIKEAVINLALHNKKLDRGGNIVVPRHIIVIFIEHYKSDISLDELCDCYLDAYLDK